MVRFDYQYMSSDSVVLSDGQRPNPAGPLVRIATARDIGALPDIADIDALTEGVRRWLAGEMSLDQALGLGGGPGQRSARYRYRESVRNHHLAEAHALCRGSSPRARSVSLVREVVRFQGVVWPRWRQLDEPPAGIPELRRHLFLARRAAVLPESESQLHAICTGS